MDNGLWCNHLIDQLVCQGVTRFCIAPGSRSTPLALAAARHPKAEITVHYDERGLGFFALGCALASAKCICIIVTSGTAVGNLLPAVMEAKHSSIPLLLLTADRPAELRDCGANQTTDQIKIFQNFVEWQTDLPCPNNELSEAFIRSQAAFAASRAQILSGPVQINCQFREPLFTPFAPLAEGTFQPYFAPSSFPTKEQLDFAKEKIAHARSGLIVIGRLANGVDLKPILALASKLRWPIFADLLSQAHRHGAPEQIQHFDYCIRSNQAPFPDCILYFGERFVSKFLPPWIEKANAAVLHIDANGKRIDTNYIRPARIQADPALFCEALEINERLESDYLKKWQEIDRDLTLAINACFLEKHSFVEPDFMRKVGSQFPENTSLFLANSMPIRDAAYFGSWNGKVFCNRGLSGIDGQIATAAGAAIAAKEPMIAIVGDQSTLHDLNSISLLREVKTPFLLIISNNFGGGIFSYLPVKEEKEHFEKLFAASHDFRFVAIAEMFSIPYFSASELDLCDEAFRMDGVRILEIFTSREENACFQKRILEKCCLALSAKRSACLAEF